MADAIGYFAATIGGIAGLGVFCLVVYLFVLGKGMGR